MNKLIWSLDKCFLQREIAISQLDTGFWTEGPDPDQDSALENWCVRNKTFHWKFLASWPLEAKFVNNQLLTPSCQSSGWVFCQKLPIRMTQQAGFGFPSQSTLTWQHTLRRECDPPPKFTRNVLLFFLDALKQRAEQRTNYHTEHFNMTAYTSDRWVSYLCDNVLLAIHIFSHCWPVVPRHNVFK